MFQVFNQFIAQPWLALIPALVLGLLWLWSRSRIALTAAILWLIYAVFEFSIWMQWTCSEDCNIRVDLLVIAPLLWIATIAGLLHASWRKTRPAA